MNDEGSAANLLRRLRSAQGRSLRMASGDLGVAPSHLSRLERGERHPNADLTQKLANYYGVSAEVVALAEGRIPPDIVEILKAHPDELNNLREKYGIQ